LSKRCINSKRGSTWEAGHDGPNYHDQKRGRKMAATRLKSLAGVQIPDTKFANAALDLLEATSADFLFNHCLRTYVFGSLAVRAPGRGAVLHDLGLMPTYIGSSRVLWVRKPLKLGSSMQVSPRTRSPLVHESVPTQRPRKCHLAEVATVAIRGAVDWPRCLP
jgi:hypothetical protein